MVYLGHNPNRTAILFFIRNDLSRNISHSCKNVSRVIGNVPEIFFAGDPAEHENGIDTRMDTGDDVRVHPVADNGRVLSFAGQQFYAVAHHDRVWLSHEVGFCTAGQLDGRNQRAGTRGEVLTQLVRQVRVGANKFGPVPDEPYAAVDFFIVVGTAFSHHHVVRVDFVHGEIGIIQGVDEPGLADDIGTAVGTLGCQEAGCGKRAGVKMGHRHLDAEAVEFFLELTRVLLAAVGQKQKFFIFLIPAQRAGIFRSHYVKDRKIRRPGQSNRQKTVISKGFKANL